MTSPISTSSSRRRCDDLVAGQALGNGELVLHDLVRNQLGLDLAQADAGLEGVFAALQRAAAAVEQRHRREQQRAVDDAGAFELLADRCRRRPRASIDDDLVFGERAGLARFDHRPDEHGDAEQADHEHEGEQTRKDRKGRSRAADAAAWAAPACRRRRRCRPLPDLRRPPNRLTRCAGCAAAPGFGLVALIRRLVHPGPCRLARQRQSNRFCGEMKCRDAQAAADARLKISDALVPPKPNEFDSATSIFALARDMRRQVDRRLDRRIVEVEGRRRDLVADRQDREDRLDRAGRAEQMADRRLGRRHRRRRRRVAEQPLDRAAIRSRRRPASRCRGR